MKKPFLLVILFCVLFTAVSCVKSDSTPSLSSSLTSVQGIETKVNELLDRMTLEEKVGQMNQYVGFWDLTGPAPESGDAAEKYEHLRKGYVGSMLNVRGVENVRGVDRKSVV